VGLGGMGERVQVMSLGLMEVRVVKRMMLVMQTLWGLAFFLSLRKGWAGRTMCRVETQPLVRFSLSAKCSDARLRGWE